MSKKRWTVGSLRPEALGSQPPTANKPVPPPQAKREPGRKMTSQPLIKIKQHDRIFTLTPYSGRTMLEAALSQNQPIDYQCRKGNCGKCKVRVIEGSELISSPASTELSKFKKELAKGYRLACQTTMN